MVFEKLEAKNKKETNRTVTKGLQHSEINVITYFQKKIKAVVPLELYSSCESANGLDFFEKEFWHDKTIRKGFNGMVENCIAVVDLFSICKKDLFSKNAEVGITKQIQMVMSKLKLLGIFVMSLCLMNYFLILFIYSLFSYVEKSKSQCCRRGHGCWYSRKDR